jgi:succinate dehydrogenase/fumarate reductase cytochrome b subunit (b558 family)
MADARDRPKTLAVKLHSLSGVVPLGAFLLLHVWVTSALVGSRAIYDRQIGVVHGGAFMGVLEVVLVLAPLAYHAGYGVVRALGPRDPSHAYANDLMRVLQRVSGVVVLVFVAAHLWEFRVQTWTSGLPVASYSTKLVSDLSTTAWGVPWIAVGYLVGIAATLFHLVNGLSSFCATWGFVEGASAARRARMVFRAGGVVFFVLASGIVVQLTTGSRYFPADAPRSAELACGTAAVTPPPPQRVRAAPSGAQSSSSPAPSALPGPDR